MAMDPQKQQQKAGEVIKKEVQSVGKPSENGDQAVVGGGGGGGFRGRGGRGFGSFRGGRGGPRGGGGAGAGVGAGAGAGRGAPNNAADGEERSGFDGGRGGRGGGRGRGRGFFGPDGKGGFQQVDRILERLKQIAGPQVDLCPREEMIRKFSNHCRLWIGNLPLDITEDDVRELFKPYGEFDEVYFDKNKGFAFVRMDYKSNAEKARQELHLKDYKNRQLKIRFSSPGTALKVRNLSTWVTNELFEKSFSVFGELEKAIVITDERGRSTGEGILEYCKKPCAQLALKRCIGGCFFLTSSPRPVIVEAMAAVDDNEGMAEINVNKRNPEYMKERQSGPRFATTGSFEFEYGLKWKQLYELFDKKKEMLEKELNDEKQKLEEQIEYAKYQHETELLREKLRQREENNQAHQQEYEQRQQQWEDHRRIEDERQGRIEEELTIKYRQQEEELRRRQEENRQFMQERGGSLLKEEAAAEELNNYTEHMAGWRRNDGSYGGGNSWRGGGGGGGTVEAWGGRGGGSGGGGGRGGQHWDRSGFQRGEDMTPAAQAQRGGFGGGRGRGGAPAPGGFVEPGMETEQHPEEGGVPPSGDLFTGRLGGRSRWGARQAPDSEEYGGGMPNKRARY